MAYETNSGQPLSKQDIKALKHCTYVLFRVQQSECIMEAVLDGKDSATGFDQRHTITVDSCVTASRRDTTTEIRNRTGVASWSWMDLPEAQTFLKLVRPGDQLLLKWNADGRTNQYVSEAGLHVDTLTMDIYRHNKRADMYERYITLPVAQSITPDNTARMFRNW